MDASELIRSTQFHDDEAHRAIRRAGLVYGILYGLFFGLAVWGATPCSFRAATWNWRGAR